MAFCSTETFITRRNLLRNGSFGSWSLGTSTAPDGWKSTLTGGGSVSRQTELSGTGSGTGPYYARITNAASNVAELRQGYDAGASIGDLDAAAFWIKEHAEYLRGKTVRLTARVRCSSASRASIKITDQNGSTASTTHTGGGAWEQLQVTRTLPASGTFKLLLSVNTASGTAINVDVEDVFLEITNEEYFEDHPLDRIADALWGVGIQDFRLTATSATPVTTADVTGATSIYLSPYKGSRIALALDSAGSAFKVYALSEITKTLGTLSSGANYDVFCYPTSDTEAALELVAWTNDTTRATALVRTFGVWFKSGDLTRRYVGSLRTTSTTTTEDSEAKRFLFNADNRVPRVMRVVESTSTWNYTTDTYRAANNSTANRLQYIQGLSEEPISARVLCSAYNANTIPAAVGIGVDSTSADSSQIKTGVINAGGYSPLEAAYDGFPGVGFHYLQWLEKSTATGTTAWQGTANGVIAGISGRIAA